MAKLAVIFFAALAFQAAFAGVTRHHHHHHHKRSDEFDTFGGQLEGLVGQVQGATRDLSVTLEGALPTNTQVIKTLNWQCRELAQTIDEIINRLKVGAREYNGSILDQIISELLEIKVSLRQTGENTDVLQLKNQLNTCVQNVAEQCEKLIRVVPTTTESDGGLEVILKGVLKDFITTVQGIQTQLQYVGIKGQQTPRELVFQIQENTNGLVSCLQGGYTNIQQIRLALREYVQNVETIISKLQREQGTIGNVGVDNVITQIIDRLRQVLVPIMQITDVGIVGNIEPLKIQLAKELEIVAEELKQLVQYGQTGARHVLIQDVLYDYLNTIQEIKVQIQCGYQGEGLYGRYGLGQRGIIGTDLIMGGLTKYGKSGKGLAMQIQAVVADLIQTLQTVYLDNAVLKQTLINQCCRYALELETIVERLEQVNFDTTTDVTIVRQVVQNLREIVITLRQICGDARLTIPLAELRRQLILCIEKFGEKLQKLAVWGQYGTQGIEGTGTSSIVRNVLVQFLIVTRNWQVQLQNFVQIPQRGQATTGFGIQIQTLANGLTAALEAVSVENKQVRDVLTLQCRELAQQIETIVERLQGETLYKTGYGIDLPQRVVGNLREIVISLRRLCGLEGLTNAQQLKMQLIVCIQEAASETQKLLWVGQDFLQGQKVDGVLYDVLYDFIAILQNQQIQLQNVYQTRVYGQNPQQLVIQIQAITNNLAIFLQNVPAKGQNIDIEVRKVIQLVENIIDRLEVEVIYSNGITGVRQVVENLRRIVLSLERVTELETSSYGLRFQLNLVLQNVAVELKRLAWICQSDLEQTQGNLNSVVRSVLVQYLVVLQRVQIELQGINQTVQIGQTPRELALQIQIVANRLSGILRVVVPDNRQTQLSLIWQVRRFYQIIDYIVDRLEMQVTKGYGKVDLLRQVVYNLNQIKLSLRQVITTPAIVNTQPLKIQLAVCVQDAAVEIQKLIWVAQSDIQGNNDILIKCVLIDFLAGLQNLQMQIQNNFQIVIGGQNPRYLAIQIQSVANRLFGYLQWVQLQPNTQQLRQTLIIQIGEFTQTIENLVEMLRTEIKSTGENTVVLQKIIAELTKISLSLQKINGVEAKITVNELSTQLAMHVQDVVVEIQRLAWIAQSKLELTKVNFNGVLNGALNTCLATLRNMLIQFQSTQEIRLYGQDIKELANQIQIVTNKLTTSLETVVTGTKQVKQAFAIQILKYARRIRIVVDRLETEVSFDSGMKVDTLRQVATSLRQIVVSLQQVAESLVTKTTIELKAQLINCIQNVDAEVQKLLLVQSSLQKYQGVVDTVVRSVLIEYLAAVQNLQIKVQFICQASQKGLTLPQLAVYIRNVVNEITICLQRIVPTDRLVKQIITTEVRQLTQVIANIVNKLQSQSASVVGNNELFQQIAIQLKEVQLCLQRVIETDTVGDIYQQRILLAVNLQRAAVIIEQLVWAVQPELQLAQTQTGTITVVREILNDFLTAAQNVEIQVQLALQNGKFGQYFLGVEGLRGLQGIQGLPYYGGFGDSRIGQPEWWLNGGRYYGGRQMIQTPQQYVSEIEILARELSIVLQDTTFTGQQVYQVLTVQARQLAQIIKTVIDQLQGQLTFTTVDTTVQHTITRLREVQLTLQRLAAYNTFTTARQLKEQFDDCIRIVVSQIQRLVLIAQESTQGNWFGAIRVALDTLLTGIRSICYQVRDVAQGFGGDYTTQYDRYGLGYGYGKFGNNDQFYGKYGQGYGYDQLLGKYGKFDDVYGKGFGYGKYDQMYGKYDQGFGYGKSGKYDQLLSKYGKFDDVYGQGFGYGKSGKYDQLLGKYGKFDDVYGQGFGYGKYDKMSGKYGQGFGYGKSGKYDQLLGKYGKFDDVYGKGFGYGKYDQMYGKYDQGFGYGKSRKYDQLLGKYGRFDDLYGQGFGYGKSGKYDQLLGKYGKFDDVYGQGFGYGKYDQMFGKYGQGFGYEKYGKYDQGFGKYDQGYGKFGKYGQGNGYGKFDQLFDKYGQECGYGKYGKCDELFGKYGLGYGHDKYGDDKYNKYGLNGLLDLYKYGNLYDDEYGLWGNQYQNGLWDSQYQNGLWGNQYQNGLWDNQYGFGLGDKYGYGVRGQTCDQLVREIRLIANKVVEELQTVTTTDKQVRQVLIVQVRQLVQIVNNMIDRLQVEVTTRTTGQFEIVREVINNLRQIQVDLQRIASSGVITTIYQIKAQIATNIEQIVTELQKLTVVVQTDVQLAQAVKEVLVQYFVCLRTIYYQYQYYTKDITSQLQLVTDNLGGYLRDTPYDTIQGRVFGQNIRDIIDRSQGYINGGDDYLPLNRVLLRLRRVADSVDGDSDAVISRYNVLLGDNIRDTTQEIKDWLRTYEGSQGNIDDWGVLMLGDYLDAARNYRDAIRTY